VLALALICIARAGAETITITTYNVEHFANHFEGQHLTTQKFQKEGDEAKELVDNIKHDNDRENWATAETILDPRRQRRHPVHRGVLQSERPRLLQPPLAERRV